jgi:hypothetical protein
VVLLVFAFVGRHAALAQEGLRRERHAAI